MFNGTLDSISPGFVNECVWSAVMGDLGHATERNGPHKGSRTTCYFSQWCTDSLRPSTRRPCPELSMVLNSYSLYACCMLTAVLWRTHCNIHDDRQRPHLAANLVTDKLRCCLGHQCFLHYLSGFILHLDHLFILDLRILVIQKCAYRWRVP